MLWKMLGKFWPGIDVLRGTCRVGRMRTEIQKLGDALRERRKSGDVSIERIRSALGVYKKSIEAMEDHPETVTLGALCSYAALLKAEIRVSLACAKCGEKIGVPIGACKNCY